MFRSIVKALAFGWHSRGGTIRSRLHAVAFPGFRPWRDVSVGPGCRIKPTDGGLITCASGVVVDQHAYLVAKNAPIVVGANSFIGTGSVISATSGIDIGADVLIAEYVTIRDQDHEFETARETRNAGMRSSPIRIGNNVWIGAKATITRGVTIGDNAVIGANAVVTKDIPANAVAVGVPARVIRMIERT